MTDASTLKPDAGQPGTREERARHVETGAGAPRTKEYAVAPYALVVTARMPAEVWPNIWYSWLSLKGHLQSFRDMIGTHQFASRLDGEVIAVFIVVCESADALAAWLREGYPVDRMLIEMGLPEQSLEVHMMRDFS